LRNTNNHLENAIRVINDSALTNSGGETWTPNILQAGNYNNPQMHIEWLQTIHNMWNSYMFQC
jgi:hypothetical protein